MSCQNNKVCFPLLSGGIDSTIAVLKMIESNGCSCIIPVFINYGQKSAEQEWNSVKKCTKKLQDVSFNKKIMFKSPVRIDMKTNERFGIFDWSKSQLITGNKKALNAKIN